MEPTPPSPPAPGGPPQPGVPHEPLDALDAAAYEAELERAGWIPPDPDEPPPLDLARASGDVAPWGTMLLVLSWGIVFLLLASRGQMGDSSAYLAHGASVTQRFGADAATRLLSSTFLHDGVAHVFFNAVTMLIYGAAVEGIFSRWSFWALYAGGGAAASYASLLWRIHRFGLGPHLSVGASGAIFALGGALLAGAWRIRHKLAVGRARAFGAAILFLATQGLVSGLQKAGTDQVAHAAGLLAGVALGAALPLRRPLTDRPAGAFVRLLGALGALALLFAFTRALRES